MTAPRVLLVEDDNMLRQFVRMALEELDMELLEADCVAAAADVLERTQVDLIVTDLMMPGESGLGLLERLRQQPALRGTARVVVLSAGVNADMRVRLQAYAVWRILLKPVSVSVLENCVREGLALSAGSGPQTSPLPPGDVTVRPSPDPTHTALLTPEQAQALQEYFGGDRQLFDSYMARCHAQFPRDVLAGDHALQEGNLSSLRLLAHSLKTVLRTLGLPMSEQARLLETACQAENLNDTTRLWAALRTQLQATPSRP